MKALVFRRDLPRFAAAKVAGGLVPGRGARVGPLQIDDVDPPELPGPDWVVVRPRLAGICGSDLATIDGASSRYFEPIVSFPFVPGHEVVGELDDGTRVVIEPVLGCITRGIDPACAACARGDLGNCERIAFGHLEPGLQSGFCADTGGGWSTFMVAHRSQLHEVPDAMSDEAAVMVEPAACAVHAALAGRIGVGADGSDAPDGRDTTVVVLGSGTLGALTVAALRRFSPPGRLLATAKHPEQQALARSLGADRVVEPAEVRRATRRLTGTMAISRGPDEGDIERLTGGADVVIDCVGSADSLADALAVVRPRGRVVVAGMPGQVSIDLTGLWHREIDLVGAYTYGTEQLPDGTRRRTFDLAFELVAQADLGRLVSATYPLRRFRDAIEHAASAGARGAVKVVFDLRDEKERNPS